MLSGGWRRPPLESAAGRALCAPVITCECVRPSEQTATLDEVKGWTAPRKRGRRLSWCEANSACHASLRGLTHKIDDEKKRSGVVDLDSPIYATAFDLQAHRFQIARRGRKPRCCM